jgi:hypothetical protein
MKIAVTFGYKGPVRLVEWWQPLTDFPRLFRYEGKKWEWFMYDKDKSGKTDYELIYSELPTYDPNFYVDMEDFEKKFFGTSSDECTCGASFSSFSWDHMTYCRSWKPW